jgi:hypothetical protein
VIGFVKSVPIVLAAENHKAGEMANGEVGSANRYANTRPALDSERAADSKRGRDVAVTRRPWAVGSETSGEQTAESTFREQRDSWMVMP